MALEFGSSEELECIQQLTMTGPKHEPLCLAHKMTIDSFLAPYAIHDDGYVLGVGPVGRPEMYFRLDAAKIKALQESGDLPTPLPRYSISALDYFFGTLLWWALGISAIVLFAVARSNKRKKARARVAEEADANVPFASDAPTLVTEGDHFIRDQIAPELRPGERITHQAYALSGDPAVAYFVALTSERLFVVNARVGAFKPLLENQGLRSFPRESIQGAARNDRRVTIDLAGEVLALRLDPKVTKKEHFSNQEAFLRDVPRLLTRAT
jgi:hypothetical protein